MTALDRCTVAEHLALLLIRAAQLAGLEPDIDRIARGAFNIMHYGTPADLDRLIDLVGHMHRIITMIGGNADHPSTSERFPA